MAYWFEPLSLGAGDLLLDNPAIPSVGPAGVATFALNLEAGATITYSWATDVQKAVNGLEQRASLGDAPKQSYKASAFLLDGDERTVRSAIVVALATAQPFLLALPFEEFTLSGDAAGTVVPVWSTALCDWDNPGQRAVVVGLDGPSSNASGVVQSSTASSITLDVAPGAVGKAGARIMPAQAVYLKPSQSFAREQVNVSHWQIDAVSALFGFAGVDAMGNGAALTSYDGFPVWHERNDTDIAQNTVLSLGEILDAGGLPLAVGGASVTDELRAIRIEGDNGALWQWFKLFCFTVKGRLAAFLRPTWQPDLVFDSNPGSSQLKIKSGTVSGAGNYLTFFNASQSHRRLQVLKTDGSVQYVTVSSAGDNGDGTITLNLNATVTLTVDMISFLETCRLESDDVVVVWNGYDFTSELVARVVQQ